MGAPVNPVIVLIAAGAVVAALIYKKAEGAAGTLATAAGEVVGTVADAINPMDSGNIFNTAVNSAGSALSGQGDWTLGGWIYDITHSEN